MKLSKLLINIFLLSNFLFAEMHITIYNQGRAFIQDERNAELSKKGQIEFLVKDLPNSVDPSSIEIQSDNIQLYSKEYIYKPITTEALLNANLGNKIELLKYNDEGKISNKVIGILISNSNSKVFEIDGKIVINPPYQYRFDNIPKDLSDTPYLNCIGEANSKNPEYTLSYITGGLDWEAEYTLTLVSDKNSEIEGWYYIQNSNKLDFPKAEVALVSGAVIFGSDGGGPVYAKRSAALTQMTESFSSQPKVTHTEDYAVFLLDGEVELTANSKPRFSFLSNPNVPFERIYHTSHSISRPRRSAKSLVENLPVNVRLQLKAGDVGDFQLPAGNYKVYESNNDLLTYVGSGYSSIKSEEEKIKVETGSTRDILCSYTLNEYEINKNDGKAEVTANFKNMKENSVQVEWIENLRDGRWEITHSTQDYEKLDAYHVKFIVNIPVNKEKELSFKAEFERE